jgi:uncharacterized protein YgiM (DUF1202 family)
LGTAIYRGPGREFSIAQEVAYGSVLVILSSVMNDAGEVWYFVRLENTVEAWLPAEVVVFEAGANIPVSELAAVVSRTPSPSPTITPSYTLTLTRTPTPSLTLTPSATLTTSPSPTPSETFTRTATFTATPTFTRTPTRTPSPTPTIPAEADARIDALQDVNLRSGPGSDFEVIGSLAVDQYIAVIGRNDLDSWYQILTFDRPQQVGWVSSDFVQIRYELGEIPITWFGDQGLDLVPLSCGVSLNPLTAGASQSTVSLSAVGGWVRIPFFATPAYFRDLPEALYYYDPLISAYNALGVKVLLVLTPLSSEQNTVWDWENMENRDWEQFRRSLLPTLERVIQFYGDRVAAYQVWDRLEPSQAQSEDILIPAAEYAPLLQEASLLIRAYSPSTQVIMGTVSSTNALYLRDVRRVLGGSLPVDGIALEAYNYTLPNFDSPLAQGAQINDLVNTYARTAPGIPLWLTEWGLPRALEEGQTPIAAAYISAFVNHLQLRYPQLLRVVLWSPWQGGPGQGRGQVGLVDELGEPQGQIYRAYVTACQN